MIVLRKRIELIADGKHFNPVLLGKYGIMANKIFIAGEKLIWISWLKIALSFNAWPPILAKLLYFVIGSLDRLDKIPFSIRNAATVARADIETFLKIILSDLL